MAEPRIPPVSRADATPDQLAALEPLGDGDVLNLFATMAHHPKLLKSWLPLGGRLLFGGLLDPRTRELAILRTSTRCGADYEWGQHVALARAAGIDDDVIVACAVDDPADPLCGPERVLLRGVDELVDDHQLSDDTWSALSEMFDDQQMIELTMLVGHYMMIAGLLRSVRVAPDGPLPPIGRVR